MGSETIQESGTEYLLNDLPESLPLIGQYGNFFAAEGIELCMNDIAEKYNSLAPSDEKRIKLYKKWEENKLRIKSDSGWD